MKQLTVLMMSLAIGLVACSGGPGITPSQSPAASQPATDQPTDAPGQPTAEPGQPTANDGDPFGFGKAANTALVVVGGQRYEFGNLYCVTIGGALSAASISGDPKVHIDLPPIGWETSGQGWSPPSVSIDSDEPYFSLDAGNDVLAIQPGRSQVDDYVSDGKHATGSATFLDTNAWQSNRDVAPVSGTFEVTCAE